MSRFSAPAPAGYILRRDVCSYGYFVLSPNHWDPRSETFWRVLDLAGGPVRLRIAQPGRCGALEVSASRKLSAPEKREAAALLARMLRLDEPPGAIREFHAVDPRWKRAGRGRLMRSPTFFEDVIKTVTSCNVTWPSTVNMNRRLCEVLGRPVERDVPGMSGAPTHSFPPPEKVARARASTLRARCRVGYRDARIIEIARLFTLPARRGGIDAAWFEDPATPDAEVYGALLELPGVGPYAGANIMQLLGRYAHLPLDTEGLRHGRSVLGYRGNDRAVMKHLHRHYEPFGAHRFRSYWFELWAHYEGKQGPSWHWEREKTATAFTASKL
jgi:3-methyladenine DNA glycosylase/8-oxoguanine DNA glycosylase